MRLIFILTFLAILSSEISVTGAHTVADKKIRNLRGTQNLDDEERGGAPNLAAILGQGGKKAQEAKDIVAKVKSKRSLQKWAWAAIFAAYLGGGAVLTKVLVDQSKTGKASGSGSAIGSA